MTNEMTRRLFLQQAAFGYAAINLNPFRFLANLAQQLASGATQPNRPASISDDDIPTRLFYPGFTREQLDRAWQTGDLVNGFPWGLVDTHTMGGIPQQANVAVDTDGSAVLTVRRPTAQELTDWLADSGTSGLIQQGEQNGLTMQLAVAAFNGRLPTDIKTVQANVTLPHYFESNDPSGGMTGIGWAFWTVPDVPRLEAMLTDLDVPPDEIQQISSRVNSGGLEEDIAEFSLGVGTSELGYPLWTRVLGNQVLTFMAGRKTWTAKYPRIDIMHTLYEPLGVPVPFFWQDQTITGWLARQGGDASQILKQPFQVKLEFGDPVYDATREVMAAPMGFHLNGKPLAPVETLRFPGLDNDRSGTTLPNLSVWQIKTKAGDWVTIPRRFVVNFTTNGRRPVTGDIDHIHLSDVTITRRGALS